MSKFEAGFARLDVTPPLGIRIKGYFQERIANDILDPLLATAVAVSDGEKIAVLISLDLIGMDQDISDDYCNYIAEKNNITSDAVFIACTHTHTGPEMSDPLFNELLKHKLSDVAQLAIGDLKTSKVAIGRKILKDMTFVRRFRMKDGTVKTWAKLNDPEVESPASTPDELVQLIKIEREGASEILLVNFQVHPDIVKGCAYSADFPKFIRDTLERSLDDVNCVFFNGTQGDLNHFNMNRKSWEISNGYEYAKHMGRSIAGTVLQIYGNMQPLPYKPVLFQRQTIEVPSNRDNTRLTEASHIIELHKQGRESELGLGSLTTPAVAEAYRIKRLENGPDSFKLNISVVMFYNIAFVGLPGEPFNDIGRRIKESSPSTMTFVCCLTNGAQGYLPTEKAYEEGGYEPRSSRFKSGVGERLVESSLETLNQLEDQNR